MADEFSPFVAVQPEEEPVPFSPFAVDSPVRPEVAEEFSPFMAMQPDVVTAADPEADPVLEEAEPPEVAEDDQAIDELRQLAPSPDLITTGDRVKAESQPVDVQAVPERPAQPPTVPEDTLVADVRADSLAYRDLGRGKAALTAQLGNLDAQISVATDPQQRAALVAQRQRVVETLGTVAAAQGEAGARADAGMAEAQERALVAKADADLAQIQAVAAGSEQVRADAEARLADIRASEDDAVARVAEDQQRYRALMARGPKATAVATTFADIATEVFRASLESRVADFAKVADRAWKRDRQAFADERQSAQENIRLSGDRVRDVARQRDAALAEEASQKAAVLARAAEQAQLAIQSAVTPMERGRAAYAYKGLQEQAEAATAQAAQARLSALQAEDKRRLDAEYKRAQIGKLTADTEAARSKAAKLARRGGVSRGSVLDPSLRGFSKKDQKAIKTLGVRHPLTGAWIADARGVPVTASSPGEAKDLRETAVASKTVIDQLNTIKAIKKGYGAKDWASLGAAGQSDAKQALQSWGVQAKAALNKAFKFGAMDSGTMELFDEMLGDPAGLWDNLGKLDAVIEGTERGFNDRMLGLTGAQSRVRYPRIQEAPKATIQGALRVLNQRPSLADIEKGRRGNVPARKRVAALDQYYDLELERTGSPREASEALTRTLRPTLAAAQDSREQLQVEYEKAKPDEFGDLQGEVLAATGASLLVDPDDGAAVNAARTRIEQARAKLRAAITPRMRAVV